MSRRVSCLLVLCASLSGPASAAAKKPAATPSPAPSPAPSPTEPAVEGLTPERMSGIWVGTLGDQALVLTIVPKAAVRNRVECLLNVGTREPVVFDATVGRSRGLEAGPLLGLGVRLGPVREEPGGQLCIPLVDDERRVRGTLSRMEPRDRR